MTKKTFPLQEKLKAFGIHLIISLFIFILLVLWLYLILYPSFYFNMSGGWQGLMLILGVDVVLGPLLTFLVFNPHKKIREIVSDLLVVGAVQLAALGYGTYTVYQEHPRLVVLYEQGFATALSYREVMEEPALQTLDLNPLKPLAGVPLTINRAMEGKVQLVSLQNVATDLTQVDTTSRKAMQPEDLAQLHALEQQHGKAWVLAVMGKYTGAYIVVDKDFNYLDKIGERPIS